MTPKIGDRIPDVDSTKMGEDGAQTMRSGALCEGKRVVPFGLPRAFTPTRSAPHLPGYLERAGTLRAKGIDRIVCTAVNDVYVMDAWGKQQGVGNDILMAADGNGGFARGAGLELDMRARGFGGRSHRYSMLIEDGVATVCTSISRVNSW